MVRFLYIVDTCQILTHVLGDVLDIMEHRHDWAKMNFTVELFKYVVTVLIPEVLIHSQDQDQEQVRGHYDRMSTFHFTLPRNYKLCFRW